VRISAGEREECVWDYLCTILLNKRQALPGHVMDKYNRLFHLDFHLFTSHQYFNLLIYQLMTENFFNTFSHINVYNHLSKSTFLGLFTNWNTLIENWPMASIHSLLNWWYFTRDISYLKTTLVTTGDHCNSNRKIVAVNHVIKALQQLSSVETICTHPLYSSLDFVWVSQYQKSKTNLDFTEATDSERQ